MGPQACCLLRTYCIRMSIVVRVGGYYRAEFTSAWGMTQGDPLSPTILNVVVDAVVLHWVSVMVEGAEEQGGRGQEGRHKNVLFYAENGMVASPDPRWLQVDFSTLVCLFGRVGLRNNSGKTVIMVFRPFQAAGMQSEAAYGIRIMGEGPLYRERQRGWIQYKECGDDMASGLLT